MHFHKTVFSEKFSTDIARSSLYSFHPMLFTVFQSVRLYSPCTTRTTNPFLHHCVRAASTVLFSFREFGPFLSPHVA